MEKKEHRIGRELIQKLRDRLDLPENISRVALDCTYDGVISVNVEFYPKLSDADLDLIAEIMAQKDASKDS